MFQVQCNGFLKLHWTTGMNVEQTVLQEQIQPCQLVVSHSAKHLAGAAGSPPQQQLQQQLLNSKLLHEHSLLHVFTGVPQGRWLMWSASV